MVNIGPEVMLPGPMNAVHSHEDGISFCVLNNAWSTNYPQFLPWQPSDANMQWRFRVTTD
jgi:hypothetical protein